MAASVDRTLRWLDDCIAELGAAQQRQQQQRQLQEQREQQQRQEQQPQAHAAAVAGSKGEGNSGCEQPTKRQRLDGAGNSAAVAAAAPAAAAVGADAGAEGLPQEIPAPHVLAPVMGGSLPDERARAAAAVADKPVAGARRARAPCMHACWRHSMRTRPRPRRRPPALRTAPPCRMLPAPQPGPPLLPPSLAARRPPGFALCGFGMGEDPALHPQLLAAAVAPLPAGKPRLLLGMVRARQWGWGAGGKEGGGAPPASRATQRAWQRRASRAWTRPGPAPLRRRRLRRC